MVHTNERKHAMARASAPAGTTSSTLPAELKRATSYEMGRRLVSPTRDRSLPAGANIEGRGDFEGGSTPGSGAYAHMRSRIGREAAEAEKEVPVHVITGSTWGDTFYGDRVNRRGGSGDYGMGRLGRDPGDGWSSGSEHASSDLGNWFAEQREAEKDRTQQQVSGTDGMSDSEQEAYYADQFYAGFASKEEFQAYADQLFAEMAAEKQPSGDDNFTGGGTFEGPVPLDRQKEGSSARRAAKESGTAGGRDGRGQVNDTGSGHGFQDGKLIGVKSGGGAGKERKERPAADIAYERALRGNFHTDPKRRIAA